MSSNSAAWIVAAKTLPLEVKPAPYTSLGDNEIMVKNGAVAINPVDWALAEYALWPLNYPAILGCDVAGEVVEVGAAVTRFKIGDRVLGHALSLSEKTAAQGAFQEYTILQPRMASHIPDTLPFEQACVLPLAVSTAASGLYQDQYLALQYPSLNPKRTGKTLLVWSGASSVGCNAIQLAVASGYVVFATASPKNFDFVKKMGASQVFDYKSETVVADLIAAFNGKDMAGAIEFAGFKQVCEVVAACEGNKFIASGTQANPAALKPEILPAGVRAKFIFGSDLKNNDVCYAVYERFLPMALAEGKFVAAPEALVVGRGLEFVQRGFEVQKKGVSARKVVVGL